MTATISNMKHLYQKLRTAGYNPKYIDSLLPDWWNEGLADTPAGLQQASLILGNIFSVQAETLWLKDAELALKLPQGVKFKHRENIESDDLSIACAIAESLAKIVLKAFIPNKPSEFYLDAGELRKQILSKEKWIKFEDILLYCLKNGIPVIHLKHLPSKAKKMEGLAFMQNGHHVITLTQNRPHGYMLFDLAHELGHISLGHVSKGHSVIDRKIDLESDDEDEKAANRFALELLTGDPECKIVPTGKNLNANELATAASRYGVQHHIDPFHIVLNYGYSKNHWGAANAAVKLIAKNEPTDQRVIKESLSKYLDFEELNEDNINFLETHFSE